jgi:hypothetical protein
VTEKTINEYFKGKLQNSEKAQATCLPKSVTKDMGNHLLDKVSVFPDVLTFDHLGVCMEVENLMLLLCQRENSLTCGQWPLRAMVNRNNVF